MSHSASVLESTFNTIAEGVLVIDTRGRRRDLEPAGRASARAWRDDRGPLGRE
jgi:hypothetical protein